MSYERGVMPSDVMWYITAQEVTPVAGKGALGIWRVLGGVNQKWEEPHQIDRALQVNSDREGCRCVSI